MQFDGEVHDTPSKYVATAPTTGGSVERIHFEPFHCSANAAVVSVV
jgi:hypothetical protein